MTDRTPAEMLEALGKPFPPEAIKQREGGGGRMYDYVEAETVIRRLNAVCPEWSFIIRGHEWRGDLMIAHGELTIPPLGTRSGFGVQKVSERGGEDLVKGSASDALKKAATQFGVGLDLYGPDIEGGVVPSGPITDAEFLRFVNACGNNGNKWKEALDLAGEMQHRWDLLIEKAPSDAYRNRFIELRPKGEAA